MQTKGQLRNDVRLPAVAGAFYPAGLSETLHMVEQYLQSACNDLSSVDFSVKRPRIFMVPHAGYIYSGPVAAYSYCVLQKYKEAFKSFLILAPAHTVYFRGFALDDRLHWVLGYREYTSGGILTSLILPSNSGSLNKKSEVVAFKQDASLFKRLLSLESVAVSPKAHEQEHAVEVQLPFLYYIFANKIKILPIVIGDVSPSQVFEFAKTTAGILKENSSVGIIVSTDFSHYLPYDLAKLIDLKTLVSIEKTVNNWMGRDSLRKDPIQPEDVLDFPFITPEQACGATGINVAIIVSRLLGFKAQILTYMNSGDTAGDKNAVVGYGSMVFGE